MVDVRFAHTPYPSWWPKADVPRAPSAPSASSPLAPPVPSVFTPSTPPPALAADGLKVPSALSLSALDAVSTATASGQAFRLDSTQLDAMRATLRRFTTASGQPGWQLDLRIPSGARHAFAERLEKLGAEGVSLRFAAAEPTRAGGQARSARTGLTWDVPSTFSHKLTAPGTTIPAGRALALHGDGWRLEYVPRSGPEALRGVVRVEVTGDDAAAGKALAAAVQKVGLQGALAPSTPESTRLYAAMRLLKSTAPAAAQALVDGGLGSVKLEQVLSALEAAGVPSSRVDALRFEEVAPGHFTVMDDQRAAELRARGLAYAYSTVEKPEHVLSILQGGQLSTTTRWANGQLIAGLSSWADVGTGGAQGVFARLVTGKAEGVAWPGRTYKVLLSPALMGRLDVWGWPDDEYGRSWGLTERNFGARLLEDVEAGGYHPYNEVVFPVANGPQWIAGVAATTEADRQALLQVLAAAGWTPSDGRSREAFVVLAPHIRADLVK